MLVVIPFCTKDYPAAERLVEWIGQLGKDNWHHSALFVAAQPVEMASLNSLIHAAKGIFGGVMGIRQNQADERGWPMSCNALFRTAVDYIEREACTPFFWCEPDCVPLVPDWLTKIDVEYKEAGKPFMGAIFDQPWKHLTGCAVYPPNVRELNPEALKATTNPWDVIAPEKTLEHTHETKLIQHVWGEGKNPPTFASEDSLKIIRKDAVLFHRCKDGTLIKLLSVKPEYNPRKADGTVVVRRTGAQGDVISATSLATKLTSIGCKVVFQANPTTHAVLRRIVPKLHCVEDVKGFCNINLDESYERDPERRRRPMVASFFDVARKHLPRYSKLIGQPRNYRPRMEVTELERRAWMNRLRNHPPPWVMICPRSNSHVCRTVPDAIWKQVAEGTPGTKFWLGSHGPAPDGIVDLKCRSMEDIIGALSSADLLLTTDTGPMHVAAALGTPLIVVEQATSTDYTLSDQADWEKVSPPLDCLNCQDVRCRINERQPPCQSIDPQLIIRRANRRLNVTEDSISVAIAIYKPELKRLNRCLEAALPQVNDIVVAYDKAGVLPKGALKHEKIRYVQSWQHDIGYGRKANFAFRHTCSKWVLLLNDDCYLEPDAIQKMRECFTPEVGIVSALLFYPNGTIQHGGTIRAPGQKGWHHIDVGKTESRFKEPVEMENVTGACVLIRREVFYEIGGFDENFYLCCEDNDMCMRIRQAGYRIMFTPHARAIHEESVSSSTTPGFKKIVEESCKRLEEKWGWYWEKNRNNELGVF